jgi:hypothetical protein
VEISGTIPMTSAQDDRRRNSQESLTASLLEEPIPVEGSGRFATYSTTAALLLSLFLAYHVVTVVLYNLPTVEVAQTLRAALDRPLAIKSYMAVNNNPPGWGLFAPNANQANYFTKVLVEDAAGRSRDMQADIYGRRAYPYLVYDRLGNLNRRVAQGETSLRPFYAAWFCREWERTHRGEPARAVVLVRRWTRIPPPEDAYATGGFHPMGLFPNEDQTVRFECDSTPGARLPDELRRRFALPARPRREMPAKAASRGTEAAGEAAEPSRDGY